MIFSTWFACMYRVVRFGQVVAKFLLIFVSWLNEISIAFLKCKKKNEKELRMTSRRLESYKVHIQNHLPIHKILSKFTREDKQNMASIVCM